MQNNRAQANYPLHRMIYFGHVTSKGAALAYLIDTHGADAFSIAPRTISWPQLTQKSDD